MAPKKADPKQAAKKEEKPKKPEMTPEMKELKEKEKALAKVAPPDRGEMDDKLGEIQKKIDGFQEKNQKLQEQIQEKSKGKEEHFRMKEEINYKIEEHKKEIDRLETGRKEKEEGIRSAKDSHRANRMALNDQKRKLGYDDLKDIDSEIYNLDRKMQTESLSLKEEKDAMLRIKELKALKPALSKYQKAEAGTTALDVTDIRENITEIKAQLGERREAKKLQEAARSKLIEARQKATSDLPGLFEKRDEINKEIKALYEERGKHRDAFNAKNREYQAYQSEVRKLRNERWQIEKVEKQKEWESSKVDRDADEATTAVVPFFAELQYLDTMIKHLKSLLPKEAEDEKKAETKVDTAGAPGEVLLAKGNREEEFFFAPTKKKQLKKKGAGGNAKPKSISHDIKTLGFFTEYKVSTPGDVSQIPKTLEELEAKVADFKVKQVKKAEDDKKKAEAKAAGKEEEKPAEEAAPEAKEKTEE